MIDKSFQALILSLGIHFLLAWAFVRAPQPSSESQPTEVEILFEKGATKHLVIDQSEQEQEELLRKLKDQANHLSRLQRRVKEEQVAPPPINETPPSNMADLNLTPKQQKKPSRGQQAEEADSRPLHLPIGGSMPKPDNPMESDFSKSVVIGGNTQGEWIPGVKEGSFTALNTDQFTYYTFFARVREAIRYRWIQRVRYFAQHTPTEEINQLARLPSPTQLEVTLNRTGDVLKIAVLKSSGSENLDEAASHAFWNASPLNNPPTELAEEDGLIRLYYSFQIIWKPNYMAKGQKR